MKSDTPATFWTCALLAVPCVAAACSPVRANLQDAPEASVDETAPEGISCDSSVVEAVVELTNDERRARGLNPVDCDGELSAVAQKHAADMCRRDYFAHVSPDGETPADRADRAGYEFTAFGENVALGPRTAADVHQGWMNSRTHRQNIVRPVFEQIGVGLHPCDGEPYWVQVFATPR